MAKVTKNNYSKIEAAKDAIIESSRLMAQTVVNGTAIDVTRWVTVISYDTTTGLYTVYCDGVEYPKTSAIGNCKLGDRVPMMCMGGDVSKRILLCPTLVDETKLSWWGSEDRCS